MTIPRGPTLNEPASLSNIQTEFLGSNPISLSEYYAGGIYVLPPIPTSIYQTGAIPASGTISIGNFLGVTRAFVFNDVVTSNLSSYSLAARAAAAGYTGAIPILANVTINPGVYVGFWSNNRSGGWPTNSTINLYNYGFIVSPGAPGGQGADCDYGPFVYGAGGGGTSGASFESIYPVNLYNYGVIGTGGGGGGGGGSSANSGSKAFSFAFGGGGGGGAGFPGAGGGRGGFLVSSPGAFGVGGTGATGSNIAATGIAGGGGAGGGGSTDGIGTGGAGGVGNRIGHPGFPGAAASTNYFASGGAAGGDRGNAFSIASAAFVRWVVSGTVIGKVGNWGVSGVAGSDFGGQMAGYVNNVMMVSPIAAGWSTSFGNVWYSNFTGSGATVRPAGGVVYRKHFVNNTGSNLTAHIFGAVDDNVSPLTVNGTAVGSSALNLSTPNRSDAFTLVPGVNVISITVNNISGQSGFYLVMRRESDNSLLSGPENWFYA